MKQEYIEIINEYCYSDKNILNPHTNKKEWWIKNNILYVYEDIFKYTSFLSYYPIVHMKQRLYHCINLIDHLIECKNNNCNNYVIWNGKYQEYCSKRCTSISTIDKRKQTSLEKYGVDNPSKSVEIKNKIKQSTIEKYGVENYSYTDSFKNHIKEYWKDNKEEILKTRQLNNIEKYGYDYPFNNLEILNKTKNTMIQKYGTQYPLQVPEFLDKLKSTNIQRYGTEVYLQRNISPIFLENRNNKDWLLDLLKTKSLRQIAEEYNVAYSLICQTFNKMNIDIKNYSSGHIELINFLSNYVNNIIKNDRSILDGKELDCYIPQANLAVEYNGLYWHSERKGKDHNYHLEKTIKCYDKGIKLIHIFENEWIEKGDIVKSILLSNLNKLQKIYARKCKIQVVSKEQEKIFLDKNHLQGYIPSMYCIGLYYNNDLVQLMSFGKPRFNQDYQFELLRTATILNYSIVGGVSRLFNFFVKNICPKSVISYSDLRYFTGVIYKNMGFTYLKNTKPSYYYIDHYGRLHNRMQFQKHKLSNKLTYFDKDLTEHQNMINNGYNRIWDCGNSVWVWNS